MLVMREQVWRRGCKFFYVKASLGQSRSRRPPSPPSSLHIGLSKMRKTLKVLARAGWEIPTSMVVVRNQVVSQGCEFGNFYARVGQSRCRRHRCRRRRRFGGSRFCETWKVLAKHGLFDSCIAHASFTHTTVARQKGFGFLRIFFFFRFFLTLGFEVSKA